ncbi:MAG: helix-turn-helix domain-containing protein [Alphaproteobacteria bacterium]
MTKAGQRLLKSVRRARAYARGESDEGFVVHVPNDIDVKAVRHKLDMTQQQFAARFGFSYDAIRDWETKRRQPERAARILLTVIDYEPAVVVKALQMQSTGGTVTAHASAKAARAQKPRASKAAKRAFASA